MGKIRFLIRKTACLPIKLYQYLISPLTTPCCRFYPTCSQYTLDAINHKGVSKGLWMALKRIIRCHPWSQGGYDPLPSNDEKI